MNEYYIPNISEFVQGFKYEELVKRKCLLLDCENPEDNGIKWIEILEDIWEEREVWWDRMPRMRTIEYDDGITISFMENKLFDLSPPYHLETYLKDGRIRAKVLQ